MVPLVQLGRDDGGQQADSRPPGRDERATEAINLAVTRFTDYATDIRGLGITRWGESP
jgi:hypothetical protein